MKFLSLKRHISKGPDFAEPDTSSLGISDKRPHRLQVVGVLPHGCHIEPNSVQDAKDLISYLTEWINRADTA